MQSNVEVADTPAVARTLGYGTNRRSYASLIRKMAKSLYPLDQKPRIDSKPVSIPMTAEEKADAQLVADLWNEFDRVRGVKRNRKWEVRSVLKQLVTSGFGTFWDQIGGKPTTATLRESVIKAAIAKMEAEFGADERTPKK